MKIIIIIIEIQRKETLFQLRDDKEISTRLPYSILCATFYKIQQQNDSGVCLEKNNQDSEATQTHVLNRVVWRKQGYKLKKRMP